MDIDSGIVSITDNSYYSGYEPVKSNLAEYIEIQTQHTGTRSYTVETTLIKNTVLYSDGAYYTTTQTKTGKASVYPYKTYTSEFTSYYDTTINTYRNDTYNRIFLSEATVSVPPLYNHHTSSQGLLVTEDYRTDFFYAKEDGDVKILGDPNNFFSLNIVEPTSYMYSDSFLVLANKIYYYRKHIYAAMTGNLKYETRTSYGYEDVLDFSNTHSEMTTIDGIAYNLSNRTLQKVSFDAGSGSVNKFDFYTESKKTKRGYELKINDNFYNQSGTFKENNVVSLITTYEMSTDENLNFSITNTGTMFAVDLENTFGETFRPAEFYSFEYSYISTDVSKSNYIDTVSSSSTRKAYYSTSFIKTEE